MVCEKAVILNIKSLLFVEAADLDALLPLACTDVSKVPQMRIDIDSEVALVTPEVQRAGQHLHIASSGLGVIPTSDVVLGRGVAVAQQRRGQLRHGVVLVRNAVVLALACAGDVVCEALQPNLWSAIGVQINSGALAS